MKKQTNRKEDLIMRKDLLGDKFDEMDRKQDKLVDEISLDLKAIAEGSNVFINGALQLRSDTALEIAKDALELHETLEWFEDFESEMEAD